MKEAAVARQAERANGLEKPKRSKRVGVGGVLGGAVAGLNVRLSRQVVNLVRAHLRDQLNQVCRVRQVPNVQNQVLVIAGDVLQQIVDPRRVVRRRAPPKSVDDIAPFQKESRQVRAILASDACNKGNLASIFSRHLEYSGPSSASRPARRVARRRVPPKRGRERRRSLRRLTGPPTQCSRRYHRLSLLANRTIRSPCIGTAHQTCRWPAEGRRLPRRSCLRVTQRDLLPDTGGRPRIPESDRS